MVVTDELSTGPTLITSTRDQNYHPVPIFILNQCQFHPNDASHQETHTACLLDTDSTQIVLVHP